MGAQFHVMFVDDDELARASFVRFVRHRRRDWQVTAVGDASAALDVLRQPSCDLVILDLGLPGMNGRELLRRIRAQWSAVPVVVLTGLDSAVAAVECLRAGALDYLLKPVPMDALLDRIEGVASRERRTLVGDSPAIIAMRARIDRIATTDLTVLVTGETGTGKELVCRRLHDASPRSAGPFVAINCGAIPDTLIDSELFGHERGAFTGAASVHHGAFERADGGTLLLDEVGELPMSAQVRLLRVLQERALRRVGGAHELALDVRVIAATHRDLAERVRSSAFRQDLYFRLAVARVEVPPLRRRGDDIGKLARHFVELHRARVNPAVLALGDDAIAVLAGLELPGNVRELESLVLAAMLECDGPAIAAADLRRVLPEPAAATAPAGARRAELLEALQRSDGNVAAAARRLGVARATFYRWLRAEGLSVRRAAA